MTPAMDGFADRLRVAMAARGNMSQGQLERAAGLSDAYVTKILGGKRGPPKSDKIEAIAVALNVRADWLTSGRLPSGIETSPVSTVVLDHRYPNATRAAEFLRHRANPVPEAAIQAAMARALSSDSDPTTDEWVIAMEYEAQRLRREGLGRVEREIADDGDMAPKKRKRA